MALAIWGGIAEAPILINLWVLVGLFAASLLASVVRMARRGTLSSLRGSPILALWLAARFIIAPPFFLIGLAWLICWALGLAAVQPLENAVFLVIFYGGAIIFATSVLADVAAAINGPRREPSSDG